MEDPKDTQNTNEKPKGGRGRKSLPPQDIRDTKALVRLSAEELKTISYNMAKQGYKHIGTYLRETALSRRGYTTRHHPDLQELIQQVRKIGANLNQIARAVNASTGSSQTEKTLNKYNQNLDQIKAELVGINQKLTEENSTKGKV